MTAFISIIYLVVGVLFLTKKPLEVKWKHLWRHVGFHFLKIKQKNQSGVLDKKVDKAHTKLTQKLQKAKISKEYLYSRNMYYGSILNS